MSEIIEREITQGIIPIGTPKAYQYDAALVETAKAEVEDALIEIHGQTARSVQTVEEQGRTSANEINTLGNTILEQIEHGYGYPFTASTSSAMTDQTKIYVYTGTTNANFTNGHWYYYNGSAWTDGGVYNSTAFETDTTLALSGASADAKVVGDKVRQIERAVANNGTIVADGYTQVDNVYINTTSNKFINAIATDVNVLVFPIKSNTRYSVSKKTVSTMRVGSGTIGSPTGGDLMTQSFETTTTDPIYLTSGASDTYLYVQLWTNDDASDMRNNAVHLNSLLIQDLTEKDIVDNIGTKLNKVLANGFGNYFDVEKYKNGDYTVISPAYLNTGLSNRINESLTGDLSIIVVPVPANKHYVVYKNKYTLAMRVGMSDHGDLGVDDVLMDLYGKDNSITNNVVRISTYNNTNAYLYLQLYGDSDTVKNNDYYVDGLVIAEDLSYAISSDDAKVGRYIDNSNRGLYKVSETNAYFTNVGSVGTYHIYDDSSTNNYRMIVVPIVGGKRYVVQKDTPTKMKVGSSPYDVLNDGDTVSVFVSHASASSDPLTIQTIEGDNYLLIQLFTNDDTDYRKLDINMKSLLVFEEKEADGTSLNMHPLTEAYMQDINHRGYNTVAPENTIPAFKLSKQNGFNWVETDVRLTSDGVFVCLHDATINRTARNSDGTTIGTTIAIADITYEDALEYDFGIWKGNTYAGTKLPTLAEVLSLCRALNMKITLEIKDVGNRYADLVNLVKQYGMASKTEYIGTSSVVANITKLISGGNIGVVGNDSNCNSGLRGVLRTLRINGNTIYYHSDIYNTDATRRAILDEIASDDFIVVSRTNSSTEALNTPQYSTIFISNEILASEIIYNNAIGE